MARKPIKIHSKLPDDDLTRVDHFSNLPDELTISILSLLRTQDAARTSVLSRRFRHLWESSLSVDTYTSSFDKLVAMAGRALLRRNPTKPLLSLCLYVFGLSQSDQSLRMSLISSWVVKARHIGVCHLAIRGKLRAMDLDPILPVIFSINSLESLRLDVNRLSIEYTFPTEIRLTRLKSLHLVVLQVDHSEKLNQILSGLCCLEDLHLEINHIILLSISSETIRKLKLEISRSVLSYLKLSIPSLEFFHFETSGMYFENLPSIQGEIPLLMRKAVIILNDNFDKDVTGIAAMLKYTSNAEELSLQILETKFPEYEMYPFPILLESGKVAPTFSRLKHLEVTAEFHAAGLNLEAVVTLFHHSPALESLRLVHKTTVTYNLGRTKMEEYWVQTLLEVQRG